MRKKNDGNVVGFGASARSSTILNFCGINNSYLDFIIDNNKLKKEGLEVLVDILDLIHDLQHEIRENYKDIAKLKYENAVAYKENAIIKTEFSTYKHNLKKAELDSGKNE